MKLVYTIVTYNGSGGYSVDSGQFDIRLQSDLNRCLALLERTCERGKSTLDVDLIGGFDRDIKLPVRYMRIGL
jgi:hypothetical protein